MEWSWEAFTGLGCLRMKGDSFVLELLYFIFLKKSCLLKESSMPQTTGSLVIAMACEDESTAME